MQNLSWSKIVLFLFLGFLSWVFIAIVYFMFGLAVNTSESYIVPHLVLLLISSVIIFYPSARYFKITGGSLILYYLLFLCGYIFPIFIYWFVFKDFGNFL